jgi:hypothetical protein
MRGGWRIKRHFFHGKVLSLRRENSLGNHCILPLLHQIFKFQILICKTSFTNLYTYILANILDIHSLIGINFPLVFF